jgi:hypothetical protein
MAIDRKISIIGLVAIVVLVVGGILQIVALASPYWHQTYADLYGTQTSRLHIGNSGLWVECITWRGATTCITPEISDAGKQECDNVTIPRAVCTGTCICIRGILIDTYVLIPMSM